MIQIIGLIVAAYACTRLLQIPLEQLAIHRKESGDVVWATWIAIVALSSAALLVIAALAAWLALK